MIDSTYLEAEKDPFITINKNLDALLNLELLSEKLDSVRDNPLHWKWVIFSLHAAIQSFMLLTLRGANGFQLFNQAGQKVWLDFHAQVRDESNKKQNLLRKLKDQYGRLKLDNFLGLYEKIKSEKCMNRYVYSKAFCSTPEQDQAIQVLNHLRNGFIHFRTDSWGLHIHSLAEVLNQCLPILKFLALDSYRNAKFEEQTVALISRIEKSNHKIQQTIKDLSNDRSAL